MSRGKNQMCIENISRRITDSVNSTLIGRRDLERLVLSNAALTYCVP